jgi:hypothetical protein
MVYEAAIIIKWPNEPRTLVGTGRYNGMLEADNAVQLWRGRVEAVTGCQVLTIYVRQKKTGSKPVS